MNNVANIAQKTRLKKTVALVGMMGSGKTAVGRALAARLRAPFLDSDEAIVKAANASISEVFARDGEPFFRDREAEVIARLMSGPPGVLSTGGGAFLSERNRETIARAGVAVWLNADVPLLWERVKHRDTRPLLRTANPRKTLEELFEARVPLYSLADLSVDAAPDLSIEEMAERVETVLLTRPDVLERL